MRVFLSYIHFSPLNRSALPLVGAAVLCLYENHSSNVQRRIQKNLDIAKSPHILNFVCLLIAEGLDPAIPCHYSSCIG